MRNHILNKGMAYVEHQGFALAAEHSHIHAVHGIHFHHILHSSALFRNGEDGRNLFIFQLLNLYGQLVILKRLADQLLKLLGLGVQLFLGLLGGLCLEGIRQIRIDSLEFDAFILHFQLIDEGLVNLVRQHDSIHLGLLEHVHVLALHLQVGCVVDGLFLLFLFCAFSCFFPGSCFVNNLCLYLFAVFINSAVAFFLFIRINLVDFQTVRQRHVFAVQVLEKDIIRHLLAELVILQAAEFNEGTDVIPVFLIFFPVGLAHAGQLVGNLLGDVIGNLLHEAVVLQRASGNVQRQIRTVDDAL